MSADRFSAVVKGWGGTMQVSIYSPDEDDVPRSTVCLATHQDSGPLSFCWHIEADEARELARVLTAAAEALDAGATSHCQLQLDEIAKDPQWKPQA